MAEIPRRLLILQRLSEHLKGITPLNGYNYDLSQSVYRGKRMFGAETQLPAVSIIESPRPDVGVYTGTGDEQRSENWVLLVQGWVEDTDDLVNPTDAAYYLAAAVEERLTMIMAKKAKGTRPMPVYPDLYRLGGLITDLQLSPAVVSQPQDEISSKAFFYLPVRIGLAADVGQPYVDG
ncbi:tail terminator [Pseudomonas phage UF_RH7]|nr:tail terminator [Pseudomonas phage UF_RH7]